MRIRWTPARQKFPAIHGRFVVDSVRGQMRVRKWPRKRGTPKSAAVRRQNAWFKSANKLAKHCEPDQQRRAIAMTLGTGLYPRDLLLKCMSAGIIQPITADNRVLEYRRPRVDPVEFQGFQLRLTAGFLIGVGVLKAPDWPLPVRDTAAFWDVTQPDRITIPPGVTMMQFFAGGFSSAVFNGNFVGIIEDDVIVRYGRIDNTGSSDHGMTWATGPIPVTEGQQFFAKYFFTAHGWLAGDPQVYFGGNVVEAS